MVFGSQGGVVSSEEVSLMTGGKINVPWRATLNKLVVDGGHDLVFNVGQVTIQQLAELLCIYMYMPALDRSRTINCRWCRMRRLVWRTTRRISLLVLLGP